MINNLSIILGKLYLVRSYRLIFFLLCIIPLFSSVLIVFLQFNTINNNQKTIVRAISLFQQSYQKRIYQKSFIENFKQADSSLVKTHLESLDLMRREKNNLEALYKNDSVKGSTSIKKRIDYLTNENKFRFNEEPGLSNFQVTETLLKQKSPVEINDLDLKNLLSFIDNNKPAKSSQNSLPQLVIQNFELKKSNSSFLLNNLTILKRDFKNEKN